MHVQTSCFFIKKRMLIFFMVDLASYYFQLSESLYYFKKNFDYTVMIKGNCWYANYWTEAKYLGAWRSVCIDSLWKFYWDIPLFASDKRRKGVTYRISVHTQCKRYRMVPSLENVGLGKFWHLKSRNLGLAKHWFVSYRIGVSNFNVLVLGISKIDPTFFNKHEDRRPAGVEYFKTINEWGWISYGRIMEIEDWVLSVEAVGRGG